METDRIHMKMFRSTSGPIFYRFIDGMMYQRGRCMRWVRILFFLSFFWVGEGKEYLSSFFVRSWIEATLVLEVIFYWHVVFSLLFSCLIALYVDAGKCQVNLLNLLRGEGGRRGRWEWEWERDPDLVSWSGGFSRLDPVSSPLPASLVLCIPICTPEATR